MPEHRIDVVIPTLNSANRLNYVLSAVEDCIPVNRIIAADGGSTDSTLDILRQHGAEVISDGGSLGSARQILIDAASTKYFLTLDSDVILSKGDWYEKASALLNSGTDCVVLQVPITDGPLQDFVSFYSKLVKGKGLFFATSATFFSKESIRGIEIPNTLDGSEDLFILLWLRDHHRKIVVMPGSGIHYHSPNPEKGRWIGSGVRQLQREVGIRKVFPLILRNIILYPFTVSFAALMTLNWSLEKYGFALWKEYCKGYFKGRYDRNLKARW